MVSNWRFLRCTVTEMFFIIVSRKRLCHLYHRAHTSQPQNSFIYTINTIIDLTSMKHSDKRAVIKLWCHRRFHKVSPFIKVHVVPAKWISKWRGHGKLEKFFFWNLDALVWLKHWHFDLGDSLSTVSALKLILFSFVSLFSFLFSPLDPRCHRPCQ